MKHSRPKVPIRRAAIVDPRRLPFDDLEIAMSTKEAFQWFMSLSPGDRLVQIHNAWLLKNMTKTVVPFPLVTAPSDRIEQKQEPRQVVGITKDAKR